MLKHFYLYDRNERQDYQDDWSLRLARSELLITFGERMEGMSDKYCCAHRVTFGNQYKSDREIPLVRGLGGLCLRMEGEQWTR